MSFFRGVWDRTQSYSEQFEWTRPCSCQDIKRYHYVYILKGTWKKHNPIGDLCRTCGIFIPGIAIVTTSLPCV